VDDTTNWKPDPFGVHELRFFSADGKPTLLVMDGGKRSYDKPPTDRAEGPPKAGQSESDLMPPQFIPAQTQPPPPAKSPAAASEETERARDDDEPPGDQNQLESVLVAPQFIPAQTQPPPPAESRAPEPITLPVPLEESHAPAPPPAESPAPEPITLPVPLEESHAPAPPPAESPAPEPIALPVPLEESHAPAPPLVSEPAGVATEEPADIAEPVSTADECSRRYSDDVRGREHEAMSHPLKVAYGVVCGVLALSALGVLYVHLHHSDGARSTRTVAPTTTTTSQPAKKPSTVVLPSRLSPTAEVAADDLVTSWSMNNRLGALAVATPTAATTLFSVTYASGMAINRGCSTSFSPIVCTFGPPGGASPTDPIFQIRVSQVAGGWYVSSVRIEN
jgi:hypothetical protein